jgi:hypothetical protein
VAGSCEHGNEPSGSIKFGEFLDYLSVPLASQEGLCSMELVKIGYDKIEWCGAPQIRFNASLNTLKTSEVRISCQV